MGWISRCHWHQCSMGPGPNRVNTRYLELDHPVTVHSEQASPTFTLNSARMEHEKLSHTQSSMLQPSQHLLKSCLKSEMKQRGCWWKKENISKRGSFVCVFPNLQTYWVLCVLMQSRCKLCLCLKLGLPSVYLVSI